jgi:3-oxo-5-alpha-steroid 4-dehydrogenase 3
MELASIRHILHGLRDHKDVAICLVYFFLTVGSFLVASCSSLQVVAQHGKMSSPADKKVPTIINDWRKLLASMTVPKSYFAHMYIVSLFACIVLIFTNYQSARASVSLVLFLCHSLRRFLECLFITNFSASRMNIGGYLAGLIHYIVVPLTLSQPASTVIRTGWVGALVSLFVMTSLWQSNLHYILFQLKNRSLRDKNGRGGAYMLPTGSTFRYVCCPHYTAEIILYLSLFVLDFQSSLRLCMLIWVVSNLFVVSSSQYDWYRERNWSEMQVRNTKRLVPFVW